METHKTSDYPNITGGTVTEAHVMDCATFGHAKHTIGGVVQELCPRCGVVREPVEERPVTQVQVYCDEHYSGCVEHPLNETCVDAYQMVPELHNVLKAVGGTHVRWPGGRQDIHRPEWRSETDKWF